MGWRCANALNQFIEEARELVPGGRVDTIGDASHSSRTSDHNPCDCHSVVCAGDIFTYQYNCAQLFDNLQQLAYQSDWRIKYVIYNRRIFSGPGQGYSPGSERDYTGSNPHTDHLHLSIQHPSSQFDRTDRWNVFGTSEGDWFDMATQADLQKAVKAELNQYFANGEGNPQTGRIVQSGTTVMKNFGVYRSPLYIRFINSGENNDDSIVYLVGGDGLIGLNSLDVGWVKPEYVVSVDKRSVFWNLPVLEGSIDGRGK